MRPQWPMVGEPELPVQRDGGTARIGHAQGDALAPAGCGPVDDGGDEVAADTRPTGSRVDPLTPQTTASAGSSRWR